MGVSAFVGEISSGVITTAFNLIILRLAGNTGVAAYGVVANISLVAVALFNGISQGSQPLLSSFYGKADKKALEKVIGLSLRTAAVTAVCIYAVIYFIGFFFAGINIVGTGILSVVESVKWAFTASVSRGFVMILLSAFTMSAVWGMTGIWLAAGFLILLIHVAVMVILAKVIKMDIFTCAVASLANVGGTATAPVLAGAYSSALVPVGILMALLGNIIGTPGGAFVGHLKSLIG